MRILFVNFEYPPLGGGGGIVNAWLAEVLAEQHEVTVLTSRAFDLAEREVVNGVEIVRCPTVFRRNRANANIASMASFVMNGASYARRMLEMPKFDIVNTHFAVPSGPVGDKLASAFGLPNVLSLHGGDLYDPSKWTSPHRHAFLRQKISRLVQRADAVVGQSMNTIENLHRYYIEISDTKLIPLGIPRPPSRKSNRAELGFSADDILIATVGRLVARKAVHQLIALVERLLPRPVRLLVIGDGPLRDELEKQANDAGIADSIEFCGFVDDQKKADLLSASDMFASSSQHEGFGLVYLEAMAAGLPIICYDYGGQTDFLDHETGAVVGLNDEEALYVESVKLIDDKAERTRKGANSLERVEQYFIDRCAAKYHDLFVDICEKAAKKA